VFDLPRVPGLVLVKSASRPVIGSRQVSGTSWTIQSHGFTAYAQHEGEIAIPAFSVRFASKRRFDQPVSEHQLMTENLVLRFELPAGAGGFAGAIAAVSELRVSERWDPETAEELQMGDAVVRTVEQSAADYPAMLLPAPEFPQVAGIAIYPTPPVISDLEERGVRQARRVDSLTYVFEQDGSFVIPETVLRHWDPIAEVWKQHILAERRFEVMAVPISAVPGPEVEAAPKRRWLELAVVLLPALLLVGWLVFRRRSATDHTRSGSRREPALPPLNPLYR
jgi:hypothetical protein